MSSSLSVSQIGENINSPLAIEVAQWATAKNQFALARRYLRLFKWIDCFTVAHAEYQAYGNTPPRPNDEKEQKASGDNVRILLSVLKWSFLGIYLFMEMFTITNALSITSYSWGPALQIEALKFWFYALAVSVVLGIYDLSLLASSSVSTRERKDDSPTTRTPNDEKKPTTQSTNPPSSEVQTSAKRRAVCKQIVIDGCDLLIPGAVVGWVPLDPVTVGMAGSISALLGASDVWARVNR
ncbi:hypothetical protein A1O1_06500 [Capronia coronata CBS 617.96]|uniref:Peroxin-11B n=1 Tax=Capronia coronata CBS 617.96 TaxID=1182541 RepID=W9Y906_9EURO|nr:uncharacterized protein A1O1_06500 [Capronia coronata CBS 617.96]EXJ86130.1 hypothetical protein A1O1_06500 [Capronia coronata CBS 617.96]